MSEKAIKMEKISENFLEMVKIDEILKKCRNTSKINKI